MVNFRQGSAKVADFVVHHGDCLDVLKTLADCSVDSVVTDPPYGLSFMGKAWDYDVPQVDVWREVLRVLKPGGHLLSFFGTRTYHRGVVAIEDAGFEIRDQIQWLYGSGFPKSLNLDGERKGWGTALKPANEPIVLARKPLIGTVASNVQAWGTGALNVDGGRVGTEQTITLRNGNSGANGRYGKDDRVFERINPPGRYPANVIHDGSEEVLAGFPLSKSTGGLTVSFAKNHRCYGKPSGDKLRANAGGLGDSGSAARFFYCAKASKADRDEGLDGMIQRKYSHDGRQTPIENAYQRNNSEARNHHPTVKPTSLMRYLCRLITPPNGTILDPFTGSGSTGKGAVLEGFNFIGIEREAEYVEIARARIAHVLNEQPLLAEVA